MSDEIHEQIARLKKLNAERTFGEWLPGKEAHFIQYPRTTVCIYKESDGDGFVEIHEDISTDNPLE